MPHRLWAEVSQLRGRKPATLGPRRGITQSSMIITKGRARNMLSQVEIAALGQQEKAGHYIRSRKQEVMKSPPGAAQSAGFASFPRPRSSRAFKPHPGRQRGNEQEIGSPPLSSSLETNASVSVEWPARSPKTQSTSRGRAVSLLSGEPASRAAGSRAAGSPASLRSGLHGLRLRLSEMFPQTSWEPLATSLACTLDMPGCEGWSILGRNRAKRTFSNALVGGELTPRPLERPPSHTRSPSQRPRLWEPRGRRPLGLLWWLQNTGLSEGTP